MSANKYCTKPGCKPGTPSNPQVILKDYFFSPVVVNLSQINNVDCGCCVTKYEIVSTNNFEVDYISSSLGEVRGHPIDSSLDWSFDYQVSCLACPDGQQFTFGPKTITGSDLVSNLDTITDVTYSELVALIGSNGLVPGSKYKITDFTTRHYLLEPNTGNDITVSYTGIVEPLIVTSTSFNTIDKLAESLLYPQDIIYYDWNPENWKLDHAFGHYDVDLGDYVIIDSFKGVIRYREDTLLSNKVGYDFRNVKFRRWAIDAPSWITGTTYTYGNWVKTVNYLYYCINASFVSNVNPDSDLTNWIRLAQISTTAFGEFLSVSKIGNNIGFATLSNSYRDFYTFTALTDQDYDQYDAGYSFRNIEIKTPKDDDDGWTWTGSILSNNIIGASSSQIASSVILESGCFGNTFYGGLLAYYSQTTIRCIIGTNIRYNNIQDFADSIVNSDFEGNRFGVNIYGCKIGTGFINNIVTVMFSGILGVGFHSNTIDIIEGLKTKNSGANHGFINGGASQFKNNKIANLSSVTLDLVSATHVYNNYDCNIFKNSAGTTRLSYYDGSDVLTIVNPTA